ncbi:hypothetical protein BZARG_2073 [Bizionia argentinensis JUB59]|uniref:Amidohydrolase-related domain-containing protein n=1 Tax=Bizionia argentinensis JUB59 TaxID=1046627 RepID=G2EFD9_9FLAO|nr:hypothetical protein [Bizionia argentinensis]EGV42914.1 hypothetical protein BZARG_2073 [Bizionia argentinensis JUB59]
MAKGKTADLVLLDPEKFINITENVQIEPIEEFGNFNRLVNRNEGVVSIVMAGGKLIFENEKFSEDYGKSQKYGQFLEKTTSN